MKTIEASVHESAQNIVDRTGIMTTHLDDKNMNATWTYDKTIPRPFASNAERVMLQEFAIEVDYIDPTIGR